MRNFTFLTNNIDINKTPENFVEMFLYQAYLDDKQCKSKRFKGY